MSGTIGEPELEIAIDEPHESLPRGEGTVLVTGACGRLGKSLVRALQTNGVKDNLIAAGVNHSF